MWLLATFLTAFIATFQFLSLQKKNTPIKDWCIWLILYLTIAIGIFFCAIQFASPVPILITRLTPIAKLIDHALGG